MSAQQFHVSIEGKRADFPERAAELLDLVAAREAELAAGGHRMTWLWFRRHGTQLWRHREYRDRATALLAAQCARSEGYETQVKELS